MKVAEPIDVEFSTCDSTHEPVRGAAVSSLSISASRIGRFGRHENGRRWVIERKARKSAPSSSGLTMSEKSKLWQRTPRNRVVGVFGGPARRHGLALFPNKLAHVNRAHAALWRSRWQPRPMGASRLVKTRLGLPGHAFRQSAACRTPALPFVSA